MNLLTFDIEEWYLEKYYFGNHSEKYKEFDSYLDKILETLDERGLKGTFFCVGGMAVDFPHIVRKIKHQGHEVGCHSYKHVWLNTMTYDEVFEDTYKSVDALEQCLGEKIKSYRAPAFSIGDRNKWAFEILSKCGIERDSSIFPAVRDFGGFPQFGQNFPTVINYQQSIIKEFPILTTTIFGKELVFSGGGYFRFFPLWFVKNRMKSSEYNICYFHIDDLITGHEKLKTKEEYEDYYKEQGTWKNRHLRYFKSNVGKAGAFKKMVSLLRSMDFVNLAQADKMIDWTIAAKVQL